MYEHYFSDNTYFEIPEAFYYKGTDSLAMQTTAKNVFPLVTWVYSNRRRFAPNAKLFLFKVSRPYFHSGFVYKNEKPEATNMFFNHVYYFPYNINLSHFTSHVLVKFHLPAYLLVHSTLPYPTRS